MTTRIQFNITDEMNQELKRLMKQFGMKNKTELFNNSVTILNWAGKQLEQGRIVGSVNVEGDTYRELEMPVFSNVKPKSDDENDDIVPPAKVRNG